ncbi:MAG TPA: FAD-dependent monooxygenase [Ignavibacteriaceae bacterium]
MNRIDCDAVIIGGGPAGAVAGIYLSRAGLNTIIAERKVFPRETLCGEFLSLEVTTLLRELGLFQKFLSLNPNLISSFQFTSRRRRFSTRLPFDGYSLKRSVFDNFLLSEASKSSSEILQPAEVKDVTCKGEGFITRIQSEGKLLDIHSRFVLGAFGKVGFLDRKLNRKDSMLNTGYKGIKFHIRKESLSGLNDSCIYIHAGNNIYCGVNTVSSEEAAVCFLSKQDSKHSSVPDHFAQLLEENEYMRTLFRGRFPELKNLEVYGAGNIYFGSKELIKNGVIMIGDAAKVIAPLAGDGIGIAFQSAKIASNLLISHNHKKINYSEIEYQYKSKWKDQFSGRMRTSRIVQEVIMRDQYMGLIPGNLIQSALPSIITATRN